MSLHRARGLWPTLLLLSVVFSISVAQSPQAQTAAPLTFSWLQKEAPQEPVTLLLTGDIMLDRYIATLRSRALADQDSANDQFPFTHMPEVLNATQTALGTDHLDLVAGNLEGPITDSSYVNNGVAMIFNFKPAVVDLLKNAGFTTFNMANNHALDMGASGPQKTHDYLAAAGIDAFGQPDTPDGPYSFISYQINGTKIGLLGFNDAVTHLDMPAALAKIKEVDPQVDVLLLAVHWGIEYEKTARDSIVEKAHQFVDAGVDFIWGTHPHVVQNHETYKGAPIYYSLGNFVFDQYWSAETQKGLVLGLSIDLSAPTQITVAEIPVELVNGGEPRP